MSRSDTNCSMRSFQLFFFGQIVMERADEKVPLQHSWELPELSTLGLAQLGAAKNILENTLSVRGAAHAVKGLEAS